MQRSASDSPISCSHLWNACRGGLQQNLHISYLKGNQPAAWQYGWREIFTVRTHSKCKKYVAQICGYFFFWQHTVLCLETFSLALINPSLACFSSPEGHPHLLFWKFQTNLNSVGKFKDEAEEEEEAIFRWPISAAQSLIHTCLFVCLFFSPLAPE